MSSASSQRPTPPSHAIRSTPISSSQPSLPTLQRKRPVDSSYIEHIVACFQKLRDMSDATKGSAWILCAAWKNWDTADLAKGTRTTGPSSRRHAARLHQPCFAQLPGISARGLKLAGWIANRIDPAMSRFDENLTHCAHGSMLRYSASFRLPALRSGCRIISTFFPQTLTYPLILRITRSFFVVAGSSAT